MPREQHPAEGPNPDLPYPSVPASVLDLFAVPDDLRPLPGGKGHSVVAGDLVLSPGRDASTQAWLSPVLARLAVALDTEQPRGVRIAMPIPARDGSWVVDGWAASRYEPDTTACTDLGVLVATARLLHALLTVAVPERPAALDATADTVEPELGPDQLVHGDLARNVLLDATGTPVVVDFAPYWRPALWAEALCVLDAVLWHGADRGALEPWRQGPQRRAMVQAAAFRRLGTVPDRATADALERLLDPTPLRSV
jgi:hypothetical protein